MSQNDYVIANQTTPLFRADLNLALQALASTSSGSAAPSPTYANMMWYDTANNILKMRSEADDAWITLGTLDQSLNTFSPAGVATVDQTTWDTGTSTTEALISPAKLNAKFNVTGTAPTYACRAWVNFNGIGTVAINSSGNVSSITDNGTGDYIVNFTTSMPDASYSTVGMTTENRLVGFISSTVSSVRIATNVAGGARSDVNPCYIAIFR